MGQPFFDAYAIVTLVHSLHYIKPWSRCIADFRCSVSIASFDVIVGTVSAAILSDALDWAHPNQALLMQTWQELNG